VEFVLISNSTFIFWSEAGSLRHRTGTPDRTASPSYTRACTGKSAKTRIRELRRGCIIIKRKFNLAVRKFGGAQHRPVLDGRGHHPEALLGHPREREAARFARYLLFEPGI
jgi:hypothetical protein